MIFVLLQQLIHVDYTVEAFFHIEAIKYFLQKTVLLFGSRAARILITMKSIVEFHFASKIETLANPIIPILRNESSWSIQDEQSLEGN